MAPLWLWTPDDVCYLITINDLSFEQSDKKINEYSK